MRLYKMIKNPYHTIPVEADHGRVISQTFFKLAQDFFRRATEDARIGPVHISLYMALLHIYGEQLTNPIYIFGSQVMPLIKISGTATYHRSIRQLHEYGYIKYVPSYYHLLGSLVYILQHDIGAT